jgi:hypothetical protein
MRGATRNNTSTQYGTHIPVDGGFEPTHGVEAQCTHEQRVLVVGIDSEAAVAVCETLGVARCTHQERERERERARVRNSNADIETTQNFGHTAAQLANQFYIGTMTRTDAVKQDCAMLVRRKVVGIDLDSRAQASHKISHARRHATARARATKDTHPERLIKRLQCRIDVAVRLVAVGQVDVRLFHLHST